MTDLRVTLMDARLFGPFTQALLQQATRPTMRLNSVSLVLGDVLGTVASHLWAGCDSFAALAARTRSTPQAALRFATPTAVGQGMRDNRRPRHALLPTPDVIFGNLVRRWNELCPATLRLDKDDELLHPAFDDERAGVLPTALWL